MEAQLTEDHFMLNDIVNTISWQDITVVVQDTQTKQPKNIVNRVHGEVKAGQLCATHVRHRLSLTSPQERSWP